MSKQVFIYIGPEKPFGLPIRHNAILADEPEKVFPQLEELFRKHRNFKRLFVEPRNLAHARKQLATKGSALSLWNAQIKAGE